MSENNGHKEAVLSRHRPVSYVATLAGLCALALHTGTVCWLRHPAGECDHDRTEHLTRPLTDAIEAALRAES